MKSFGLVALGFVLGLFFHSSFGLIGVGIVLGFFVSQIKLNNPFKNFLKDWVKVKSNKYFKEIRMKE